MTKSRAIARAAAIDGWMTVPELEWLYDRASESQVVIEVGVWKGRSTYALCAGCPGAVIAIDHFGGSEDPINFAASAYRAERENIREAAYANLESFLREPGKLYVQTSADRAEIHEFLDYFYTASARYQRRPIADLLFIDGDHSVKGVSQDLELARWVKPGGIISGHDINEPTVQKALEGLKYEVAPDTTIWWMRKED